jgi:hypothetical protein
VKTKHVYIQGAGGPVKHRVVRTPLAPLVREFDVGLYPARELVAAKRALRSGRYDPVVTIGDGIIEGHELIAAAHALGMTTIRAVRMPKSVLYG